VKTSGDERLPWTIYVIRGLSRRRLRTTFTITGIAVCLSFFVVLSSLSEGMKDYLLEEIEESQRGMVYMYASPAFTEGERDRIETIAMERLSEQGYTGRLEVECYFPLYHEYGRGGFAYYEKAYALMGVPKEGAHLAWTEYDFTEELLEGHHLDEEPEDARSIVLGHSVWRDLYPDVHMDDVIDLAPTNATWEVYDLTNWTGELPGEGEIAPFVSIPSIPNVTVVGILAPSKDHLLDDAAFMPLKFLLSTFKYHNPSTGEWFYPFLELIIEDARDFDFNDVEFAIMEAIPRVEGWDNREWIDQSWAERMSNTVNGWFLLVSVIIAIVTILGVSNTMAMSVSERSAEIGVLRAIGFRKRYVKLLVYAEALIMVVTALAIGLTAGALIAHYFDSHFNPGVAQEGPSIFISPAHLGPMTILLTTVVAVLFCILAASLPARRAARMDVLEVMRGE
jgi:ABC-type lipoprotein release transport system permease subunit